NVFGFAGKQPTQDEAATPAIYTNLMVPVGDSLYLADGVGTGFGNQFSAKVDEEDANKLWNFDENISLYRDTKYLSIELRPMPVLTDTLFFRLYLRQKPYTLQLFTQNFENLPLMRAWLVDKYLNTKTEINLHDTTLYNFTPNLDTLSYRNRFMLVFNRQFTGTPVPVTKVINQDNPDVTGVANSITETAGGVTIYPNPVSTSKVTLQFSNMDKGDYEVTVYSPKGQKLASREINYPGGNTAFPLPLNPSWNAGVYNVGVINKDSKKIINLKLVISK
ncbi:MAG: T9SS type A sorting domain-containing protein, partial [Parafilimonas sp.]